MQSSKPSIVIITTILVIIGGCSQPVGFNKDIMPILVANCLTCHDGSGEGSSASGFSVQSYESIMKGTKHGPVIVPGSSESSTLYRLIGHKVDPKIQMPPHHNDGVAEGREDALTPRQVEFIAKWIDQGAQNN